MDERTITISFPAGFGGAAAVDRDSTRKDHGREGFIVSVPGLVLLFNDERDAEEISIQILRRLGYRMWLEK